MKNLHITSILAMGLLSLCFLADRTEAATLTYDEAGNKGWFASDAWVDGGDLPTTWADGSSAVFQNGLTSTASIPVVFNGDATVDTLSITDNFRFNQGGDSQVLTLTGGQIMVNNSRSHGTVFLNTQLIGSFALTGGGLLVFDRDAAPAVEFLFQGTATIDDGILRFTRVRNLLDQNSNFVVNNGGRLELQFSMPAAIGSFTINDGGTVQIGRTRDDNETVNIASLSGTGGLLFVQGRSSGDSTNPGTDRVKHLRIQQSFDTAFDADIQGVWDNSSDPNRADSLFQLTHQGIGTLTLGGDIHLERQTAVTAGRLNINSENTQFANRVVDEAAIYVNGGTLGGTGTITVIDNSNVELSATGRLAAGLAGVAGRTTYVLGSGTLDLSAATASVNQGWLLFDLGSATTPGTTYDQILLTSGTLDIGDGLNFSDFDFTLLPGFGYGAYVLFDTSEAIVGELGDVMGQLGGYDAELLIVGNNLVLQVIPEPATWLTLGLAAFAAAILRRRSIR